MIVDDGHYIPFFSHLISCRRGREGGRVAGNTPVPLPSGKCSRTNEPTEVALTFLRDTRVGCMVSLAEEEGQESFPLRV